MGHERTENTFRTKDLDLITFLRYQEFHPLGNPVQDPSGTRWVHFNSTPHLKKAVLEFMSGNQESRLLAELRRTRSFVLDTAPQTREDEEKEKWTDSDTHP